ncbi:hypothetical protein ANCDUO_26420, partial [Ancylostoma duodenale]
DGEFVFYCKNNGGRCRKVCIGCQHRNKRLYDGDRYSEKGSVYQCEDITYVLIRYRSVPIHSATSLSLASPGSLTDQPLSVSSDADGKALAIEQ